MAHFQTVLLEINNVLSLLAKEFASKKGNLKDINDAIVYWAIPFGYFQLKAVPINSTIDCTCLFPRFLLLPHYFITFFGYLQQNPKVKNLFKMETAYIPNITMIFDDVRIDMSFAILDYDTIGDSIDLSDDILLVNPAKISIRSLNSRRSYDLILKLDLNVEPFENFSGF
jgi:poly(A) polymerase